MHLCLNLFFFFNKKCVRVTLRRNLSSVFSNNRRVLLWPPAIGECLGCSVHDSDIHVTSGACEIAADKHPHATFAQWQQSSPSEGPYLVSASKEFAISLLSCLSLCCCLVHSGGQAGSLERLLRVILILIHALVTCLRKLAFFQACVDDVGQSLNIPAGTTLTKKHACKPSSPHKHTLWMPSFFLSVGQSANYLISLPGSLQLWPISLSLFLCWEREGVRSVCVCERLSMYFSFLLWCV